jgi:DNA-binding NtrC family response regulator
MLGAMAYLTVREPGRVALTFDLGEDSVLGREPGSSIVVSNTLVSRRHLRIVRVEGGWELADLGSSRGTFVNGERIAAPRRLRDLDQVQAGNVILVFHDQGTPEAQVEFHATTRGDTPRGGDDEARRLRLFYDVARAIAALGDLDALIASLLDGVLEVLACERGLVGLTDRNGALRRRVARGGDELVLSGRLLAALRERKESAIVGGGPGGEPPAIAAPLLDAGRPIGFIYVAGDARRGGFTVGELEFLNALAFLTASAIEQASQQRRLADVAEALREDRPVGAIVGESEAIVRLRARLRRMGPSESAVLVRGESGTGKELVARSLHALSRRADRPFVAVNCAAIPESLIESELFGHEQGSFTGAVKGRRGKFALADGGTLFLDEVADLSAAAQAKVLRAIEIGEIHPVGAEEAVEIDVRVVSATHKDLEAEIAAGRFRRDLYYRLNVVELVVPPLRDRGEDVVLLAESFLERAAAELGRRGMVMDADAVALLRRYHWPGNVRQLANEVERAILLADGDQIDFEDLRERTADAAGGPAPPLSMRAVERAAIARVLESCGGNVVAAARTLGMARATLYRKLKRYGLKGEP